MAREQGTFTQSANYELEKEGTIDARQFVDVFADLLNFTAGNYIAQGFPVTVRQDSTFGGETYKKGWYQFLGGALNDANNWEFMGGSDTPTLQELVDAAQNIDEVIIEFLGGNTLENEGGVGGLLSLKGNVALNSKNGINWLQVGDNGVIISIGGSAGSAGEVLLSDGNKLYYGAYDYNNLDNLPDLSVFDNVDTFPTVAEFPAVGEADVFYIDNSTGKLYRWNGTGYSIVAGDLALGETASTAYRGDRGKIAYDHSQSAHAPSDAQKNSDITKGEIEDKLTGNITSHTHTVDAYTKLETDEIAEQKQDKDLDYGTIAEMLLGQGDQSEGQTIRVDDASGDSNITFPTGANKVAYYKYLGVSTQDLEADYDLVSAPFGRIKATLQYHEFACSDEGSDLAIGELYRQRLLRKFNNCTRFDFGVVTAPTGSKVEIDVLKNGVSIFTTKATIDVSGFSTIGASVQQVISGGSVSFDAGDLLVVEATQVGSSLRGNSLKAQITYTY